MVTTFFLVKAINFMDFIDFIKCYQLLILCCCAQYTPLRCRDLDHIPVTSEEGTCLHGVPSKGDNEHYPNRVILENAGLPPMTDILIQMNLCREDGLCQASQAAVVLPVARWREKSRMNQAKIQVHCEKKPRYQIGTWRQQEKDSLTWRNLIKP